MCLDGILHHFRSFVGGGKKRIRARSARLRDSSTRLANSAFHLPINKTQNTTKQTSQFAPQNICFPSYMASAWLWQATAKAVNWAFAVAAWLSAAARSKCVAASMNSAAERGPASQVSSRPRSTRARMRLAA